MPQINNFPAGFASGITIRGVPVAVTHPGRVFWVSNSTVLGERQQAGSDGNKGTFDAPFATITGALAAVTASRGDIVMVKPGHAETISAAGGIVLSKAGVAIIGLGYGSLRPTITYGTANTASMTVTASNVSISNFIFKANFLNVAGAIQIANAQVANDLTVDNCEFRDNSVILNFVAAVKVGTTANIADGLTFTNNKVLGLASSPAANTTAVVLASDTKRVVISDNFINHEVALNDTATLLAGGALNHTQLLVARNKSFRPSTSTTGGNLISSSSTACSGLVSDNQDGHLDNTAGLMIATGTKLAFFRNFSMITGAADKSALENPVAV
jgi:hypothetical protein